jgi:hypothetical protein
LKPHRGGLSIIQVTAMRLCGWVRITALQRGHCYAAKEMPHRSKPFLSNIYYSHCV